MLPLVIRPIRAASIAVVCVLAALAPFSGSSTVAQPLAGHVNRVSPAAKSAIDKYAKLVYRATDLGVRTASGNVTLGADAQPLARFTFTAPRTVQVEWTPEGAAQHRPPSLLGALDLALTAGFTGVPIPDESEYDAQLERGATGDVLAVTCFRGDVVKSTLRVELDANGLAQSVTTSAPAESTGQPSMTTALAWKKCGASYRVESMTFAGGGIGAQGSMTMRLSYEQFGQLALVTAWTIDATLRDQSQTLNFRVGDLSTNGRPAAARNTDAK